MKYDLVAAAMAVVATCALAPPAAAQTVTAGSGFSKGRVHFFVGGGPGHAFDDDYFVLSLGASYYVVDGLALGLAYEKWTGGNPSMYKLTPSVTYVFQQPAIKPYVGGFYRRTSIEDRPDLNSVGGRAGVYFQAGRNAYIGVGGVYESYLDCDENVFRSCHSTYGEVTFTFAF
ncbi:MAG TPA: hypothetical protein VH600_10685 [Burkholderiales bacterium]|jgi:hypothetical protein